MDHASDKLWHDPRGNTFWKKIGHIAPAFDCSTTFRMGNGEKIKFWHDNWLGQTLRWKFPNLYNQATNKQASLSQCTDGNDWLLVFPTLSHMAQAEKIKLDVDLLCSPLPQPHLIDEVLWSRATHPFLVNSAYNFMSQTPSPNSPLQNVWKIKAPMRVTVFAWLLLSNRLTTIDNLAKRGWILPNMCMMCKVDAETVHHLFEQCAVAAQIRDYILTALPSTASLTPRFAAINSTEALLDPKENNRAREWEITTCYVIWRERCRRIFSGKFQSHLSIVREIKLELTAWFGR